MMGWHHGAWPLYSRSGRWAERRAGVANGAVVVPGSAGLLRRVVGAAEMAVRGLVIFSRLLVGLAVPAWLAQAASSGTDRATTCFAVDVSGSDVVDGEPRGDSRPIFVRQQVVEPYAEVIANPGEAAGQQVGVARDAGQILLES